MGFSEWTFWNYVICNRPINKIVILSVCSCVTAAASTHGLTLPSYTGAISDFIAIDLPSVGLQGNMFQEIMFYQIQNVHNDNNDILYSVQHVVCSKCSVYCDCTILHPTSSCSSIRNTCITNTGTYSYSYTMLAYHNVSLNLCFNFHIQNTRTFPWI